MRTVPRHGLRPPPSWPSGALLLLTAGSLLLLLAEPIRAMVGERLQPWLRGLPFAWRLALAVALGLAGGGLVALARWLWRRARVQAP